VGCRETVLKLVSECIEKEGRQECVGLGSHPLPGCQFFEVETVQNNLCAALGGPFMSDRLLSKKSRIGSVRRADGTTLNKRMSCQSVRMWCEER